MQSRFPKFIKPAALISATVVGVLNLLYLTANNLHPDEAYYWVWSRDLQPGYLDNSPGIAYLLRLATVIGGNHEFWIRFPCWLGWVFSIWFVYFFAAKLYKEKSVGYLAAFTAIFVPLVATGSHLMTPDILMTFFASWTWYFLYLAVEEEKRSAWYGVGFCFGLALFTKFQAALIVPIVLLMLLLRPTKRKMFGWKEPYLACLIGLLCFLPVLYWNWQHNWAAFLFQGQHGVTHTKNIKFVVEFLAGQLLVFSLLLIPLCYYTAKRLIHFTSIKGRDAFLIGCFLPIFLFFSYTSLGYPAAANWPAIAYLPAIVFLAGQFHASYQKFRSWGRYLLTTFLIFNVLFSSFLVSLIRYPDVMISIAKAVHRSLPAAAIRTNESNGWDQLGRKIDQVIISEFPGQKDPLPVFSDGSYQIGSEIMFYTKKPVVVFATRQSRRSFFDDIMVKSVRRFDGRSGLIVVEVPLPANAQNYFMDIRSLGEYRIYRYNQEIRKLYLYWFDRMNGPALYEMARHKPLGYPGLYKD